MEDIKVLLCFFFVYSNSLMREEKLLGTAFLLDSHMDSIEVSVPIRLDNCIWIGLYFSTSIISIARCVWRPERRWYSPAKWRSDELSYALPNCVGQILRLSFRKDALD